MVVMGDECNFVGCSMRVKTDISIKGGNVRLSARAAKELGLGSGMILGLHWAGEDVYLRAIADPDGKYYGHVYRTHGGWRCSNIRFARELTRMDAPNAVYRCGECVEIHGERMLSIITRRNYAKC